MDLRSSRSRRSPLARLTGNQQNQRNRNKNDSSLSANGGRATRSTSRKIRKSLKIEEGNETATSNDADDLVGPGSHVIESRTHIPCKQKKNAAPKVFVPPKKKKFKMKKRTSIGRWEPWEKLEFLRGLRRHGKGHWKKIGEDIPTRTTVQVKTHAQVMLRKLDNGVNIFEALDKYEAAQEASTEAAQDEQKTNKTGSEVNIPSFSSDEDEAMQDALTEDSKDEQNVNSYGPEVDRVFSSLDEHEAMQEALTEGSKDEQNVNNYGPEVDRLFSSFPLPLPRLPSNNAFPIAEAQHTNEPQNVKSRHGYTLGQSSMGGQFETSAMAVPSLFQPVTTTTVTTTMVGNHALQNVFRPPNHHFYGMDRPSFIQPHDPYRITPSFDGIARSTSTGAAAVAASAFFPANTFHVPMASRANPGSSVSGEFRLPSQNNGVALHDDEVEAIRVLVGIGDSLQGDFPQSQNTINSGSAKMQNQENDEPILYAV